MSTTFKDWIPVESVRMDAPPFVTLSAKRGKGVACFNPAATKLLGLKDGQLVLVLRPKDPGASVTLAIAAHPDGGKVYGKGKTVCMSGGPFSTATGNAYSKIRWKPEPQAGNGLLAILRPLLSEKRKP